MSTACLKGVNLNMIEFTFGVQLLIEGDDLCEESAFEYISATIIGDSLLAVGDESLLKIHYHTNEPWQVLQYCASLGEIHDIVVENMERQVNGLVK